METSLEEEPIETRMQPEDNFLITGLESENLVTEPT